MNVFVPKDISNKIKEELEKAGEKEIGGILLGEHTNENEFKVCEISVQRFGGNFAFFERIAQSVIGPIRNFFDRTGHNYKKFNYLGEWHSHPSFMPRPSRIDDDTMQELINDDKLGANFIVLMIVKLGRGKRIEGTVTIYQMDKEPFLGNLFLQGERLR